MQKVRKCLFQSGMKETLLEWTFWLDFIKYEYGYLVMNSYLQERELRCGAWNPFPLSNTCWSYRGGSHLEGQWVQELLSLGLSSNAALARHNEGRACVKLMFNLILFTWEGSGLAAFFLPFWICFLKKMEKSSLLHQCFQPQKKMETKGWKVQLTANCVFTEPVLGKWFWSGFCSSSSRSLLWKYLLLWNCSKLYKW